MKSADSSRRIGCRAVVRRIEQPVPGRSAAGTASAISRKPWATCRTPRSARCFETPRLVVVDVDPVADRHFIDSDLAALKDAWQKPLGW